MNEFGSKQRRASSPRAAGPLLPHARLLAVCLDAIARDERRTVLAARAAADDEWAGQQEDVVWLGPIPNSVLEPGTQPASTPEAMTLDIATERVHCVPPFQRRRRIGVQFLLVIPERGQKLIAKQHSEFSRASKHAGHR